MTLQSHRKNSKNNKNNNSSNSSNNCSNDSNSDNKNKNKNKNTNNNNSNNKKNNNMNRFCHFAFVGGQSPPPIFLIQTKVRTPLRTCMHTFKNQYPKNI